MTTTYPTNPGVLKTSPPEAIILQKFNSVDQILHALAIRVAGVRWVGRLIRE